MQRNTGLSFSFHPILSYTCDLPPKISLEGRCGFLGAEKLSPEDNKDLILSHSDLDMERTQVSQLSPTFMLFTLFSPFLQSGYALKHTGSATLYTHWIQLLNLGLAGRPSSCVPAIYSPSSPHLIVFVNNQYIFWWKNKSAKDLLQDRFVN